VHLVDGGEPGTWLGTMLYLGVAVIDAQRISD
jgi:hypothetical protein